MKKITSAEVIIRDSQRQKNKLYSVLTEILVQEAGSVIDYPTAEQEGRAIFYSDYHLIQIPESCEVTFAPKGNEYH